MKHFVILSTGAYSEYSPCYYGGEEEITQEEMDFKAREIGDKLIKEYNELPERKVEKIYSWQNETEKFNPETNKTVYPPKDYIFNEIFSKWLIEEKGYEELVNIPEVNVYYDLPHN